MLYYYYYYCCYFQLLLVLLLPLLLIEVFVNHLQKHDKMYLPASIRKPRLADCGMCETRGLTVNRPRGDAETLSRSSPVTPRTPGMTAVAPHALFSLSGRLGCDPALLGNLQPCQRGGGVNGDVSAVEPAGKIIEQHWRHGCCSEKVFFLNKEKKVILHPFQWPDFHHGEDSELASRTSTRRSCHIWYSLNALI